jgi:hypothetical protein
MNIKLTYNITEWPDINYWGITKAGNTSIKFALIELHKKKSIKNSNLYKTWVHSEHNGTYISKDQALTNGKINFTVIRNPYTRFESMWKDIKRRPDQFFKNKRIDTLEEFFDYLERTEDEKRNVHFRSQSYFISDGVKILPDHVFDIEDKESINKFLNIKLEKHNSINSPVKFTDNQISRIYSIYEKDFKILGYDK